MATGSGSVWRSENAGTHTIARVLIHPKNREEACVCATGHLWGYEGDRGIFHTTDGGKTWKKWTNGLPNDGKTGCTDLVRDPKNPKILYAAMYHRLRRPRTFHSGGEQGGIYKFTDKGKSWKRLTGGLPQGPTDRIGLVIYEKNPRILMALVEAERSDQLDKAGSGLYRSEDSGNSWTYVNRSLRRYRNADAPAEARAAIDYLYTSYLEYPVDEDLRIPLAGPGTFRLQLRVGDQIFSGSLVVREDPLLSE